MSTHKRQQKKIILAQPTCSHTKENATKITVRSSGTIDCMRLVTLEMPQAISATSLNMVLTVISVRTLPVGPNPAQQMLVPWLVLVRVTAVSLTTEIRTDA